MFCFAFVFLSVEKNIRFSLGKIGHPKYTKKICVFTFIHSSSHQVNSSFFKCNLNQKVRSFSFLRKIVYEGNLHRLRKYYFVFFGFFFLDKIEKLKIGKKWIRDSLKLTFVDKSFGWCWSKIFDQYLVFLFFFYLSEVFVDVCFWVGSGGISSILFTHTRKKQNN